MLPVLDLFRIAIGPSSSHTVGHIRIAQRFVAGLSGAGLDMSTKYKETSQGGLTVNVVEC